MSRKPIYTTILLSLILMVSCTSISNRNADAGQPQDNGNATAYASTETQDEAYMEFLAWKATQDTPAPEEEPTEPPVEPVEESVEEAGEMTEEEYYTMLREALMTLPLDTSVIDEILARTDTHEPLADTVTEEAQPIVEEEVEPILEEELPAIEETVEETPLETLPKKEPNVQIDGPIEAFTKEDRARSVTVKGEEVPDWFIYIATVLILATLVSLCYIAKQRKEAQWYRRRDRE